MRKVFKVFRQEMPVAVRPVQITPYIVRSEEWKSKLTFIGTVEAYSGAHAIHEAKQLPEFQRGMGLGLFPIVQEVKDEP